MRKGITFVFLFISIFSLGQVQVSNVQRRLLLDLADELEMKNAQARTQALEKARREGWIVRSNQGNHTIELDRIDPETGIPMYFISESNLNAANTMGTQKLWPGGTLGLSLTGAGINVGEWDGGAVRRTHQEFGSRVTQVDGATTLSDHATHVAGTIMATGVQSASKGMAYEANLRAYDWNSDGTEMATAAANGLLLSNHSYGYLTGWYYNFSDSYWYWYGDTSKSSSIDSRFGYYDATAQSWDQIAFNAPNYLIVKSAGNDRGEGPATGATHKVNRGGSWVLSTVAREKDGGALGYDCVSYNGVAKNILTIGAVNINSGGYTNPSSVVMSSFSGWGPTDDGRIKPDVVSPGVSLYSAGSASNTSYTTKSGTSMASPAATGSLLLVQQHANNVRGSYLRAATLKGLTIHTADEAGTTTGPDYRFGWGLINTSKAAEVISNTNFQNIIRENTLSNGSVQTLRVYSDGTSPLKATICWADPAATPSTLTLNSRAPRLINDLDVRIYREGTSDSIFPYRLDPANPANAATTGDNVVDNVEQVLLNAPSAGYYIIRVSHKRNLLSNAPQNYSMIVTGGNTNTLVLNNIPSFFKLGTTYTLSFSKTGTFGTSNAYAIEFFPTSGGNTLSATTTLLPNDSVRFSMPAGFIQGISYQIRLKSSLPVAFSNNATVNISYLQTPTIWASKSSACAQDTLTLVTTPQSAASIVWLRGTSNIGNIPTLAVTGPGNYSIRISDAFQQLTSSNLIVTAKATTSIANAGANQIGLKSTSAILNGSTPAIGEKGKWRKSATSTSPGNFVDDTVRNTTFTGVLGGIYDLIWQHQGDCGNTEDTVRIQIDACTAVTATISATICAGSSYFFNGSPRNSAGTYIDTLVSSLGCDSVVTLTLNVNQPTSSSLSATICAGSTYSFGGVNRSSAGTYTNTLVGANGCDSVVTLQLVVNPVSSTLQTAVLCEGDSLSFGAISIMTSGIYTQVFPSSLGCDSTVQLTVNVAKSTENTVLRTICEGDSSFLKDEYFAVSGSYSKTFLGSNGCDSVVTLQLTVLPKSSSTTVANFCSGGTYDWNGSTYFAAGTYTASFPNSAGCDSTATLILNEIQPQFDTIFAYICPQGSYDFDGSTLNTPGTYVANLKSTLGCDSTVTLILSPRLGDTTYFSASICEGTEYTLDGNTYREGGEYELFYRSIEGCDSVIYFTLNVLPASNTLIQASICSGSSYVFQGGSYNTSGTYSTTFVAQNGCDSVVTLDLTVNPVISSNISASICAGSTYAFGGRNLGATGTYVDSLQTSTGCDSVVTLDLTVNPVISSNISASICAGSTYAFGGRNIAATGTYVDSLQTSTGCDSVVTLDLTVNPVISSNISASICAGSTYAFGGRALSATGTYVDSLQTSTGCDSVVTLDLTVNPVISSNINASICAGSTYAFGGRNLGATGTYVDSLQTSTGCDSVVTLDLIVNQPASISISTNGNSTICSGSSVDVVAPSGFLSYAWSNGATSSFISVGTAGVYSVSVTDANGCVAQSNTLPITVQNAVPARPIAIVGELNPCGFVGNSQTLTYSTDAIPNALSYSWLLTDGIAAVGRADSNVITVTYPLGFSTGQIRITPVNACGNGLARAIYPKLEAIATVPVFTQSVTSVCNLRGTATTATYSILPISGCSSYQWTLPSNTTLVSGQGTTSIQVTFGSSFTNGSISVTGISSCGNSPSSAVSIVLLAKPIIGGSSTLCSGSQSTYTTPVVPGAIRYRFNLPAGLILVSQNANSAVIRNTGSFISGNISAQVQTTLCGWSQPGTLSLNTAACRSSLDGFSLMMYPNPTSGELQLQFGVAMKHVQVSVYGSDGRLMKRDVFGGIASQNLNYSGLAEGLYHVEVLATDAENNVHRRMEKVLIQR